MHLVETVHAGRGLLGDALDALGDPGPPLVGADRAGEQVDDDVPLLRVVGGRGRHGAGLLVLGALVHQQRGVAAVVEDHVGGVAVRPGQRLLGAPPVLLQRLALPGEDGHALRVVGGAVGADDDGGGGVVLGGEDVAAHPAHLGAERHQRLDEDGGLDGHVQGAHDLRAAEGLGGRVFLADRHEAGHLVLGEPDLLAAEVGK